MDFCEKGTGLRSRAGRMIMCYAAVLVVLHFTDCHFLQISLFPLSRLVTRIDEERSTRYEYAFSFSILISSLILHTNRIQVCTR